MIIAMIPARLGSKRVKNKNLRLLGGKPLVCHVVETCKQAGIFDDIYINSESDLLKPIADQYGVKFYKRPEYLASDTATNDDFVFDFIRHIPCDIIIQVNPTSPFITVDDLQGFVKTMQWGGWGVLLSVKEERIEALWQGIPLNFNPKKPMPPSQNLDPILLFSSGIMGWRTDKYYQNMKDWGCATYDGSLKAGYYILNGYATTDIDTDEDFQLAEAIIKSREHSETDVPTILKNDGVTDNNFESENRPVVNISDFLKPGSWSKRIINTENNSATLICQLPGEGNRLHYHPDWNEWWYIVSGEWEWEVEGKTLQVRQGDIVFIGKGKWHKITAIGTGPSIRLAVSREDVPHVYE